MRGLLIRETEPYQAITSIEKIKHTIDKKGPVNVYFEVGEDFLLYRSGIYDAQYS